MMLNIVLTRIDDRLIHGQVITAWARTTSANRIIIIDDDVAQDPFIGKILRMAAPSNIKLDVASVDAAVHMLKEDGSESDKVIILVKKPSTVKDIIMGGVVIKELNVGGMGAARGRKKLYKNISVSQEEKDIFKDIMSAGTKVFIKIVPDDKEIDMNKLL